ncbi:hypothetical protein EYF80_066794 [Liparis tanakae]|uniref:Uncharacterized protein n=1 Tax=Liparis tanakae TaxID=230148 RepID=A0A4Z2E2Z9_9TELE|nr:hypothetical protein EYF80_066794 [Liparis tanakae]
MKSQTAFTRVWRGWLVGVVMITNVKNSLRVSYLGIDCCDKRSNFQDLLDHDEDGGPHEKDGRPQDQMTSGGCLSFSGRRLDSSVSLLGSAEGGRQPTRHPQLTTEPASAPRPREGRTQ